MRPCRFHARLSQSSHASLRALCRSKVDFVNARSSKNKRRRKGPALLNGWSGEHFDVLTDDVYRDDSEELASMSSRRLLQLADEHFQPFQSKDSIWRELNGERSRVQGLGAINVDLLSRIHR
jgi:hypothetical protein